MSDRPAKRNFNVDQASLVSAVSTLKHDILTLDEIVCGERHCADENSEQLDRQLTRKVYEILIDPDLDECECLDRILTEYRRCGWAVDAYLS